MKEILHKTLHKDLSITFTDNLQLLEHYTIIAAKAYQTLGLLCCTFRTNSVLVKNSYTFL